MKVFISGKISGLNYEDAKQRFDNASKFLESKGFEVVSPINDETRYECWCVQMMRTLSLLLGCDAIFMLKEWEESDGAYIEFTFAKKRGLIIMYE